MLPLLLLFLSIPCVLSLNNGLGLTPAMGWNTWNHYGCDISETLIKQSAEALVSSGLAGVGYVYVNLDDCWQVDRNQDGTIIADPEKFPSGIPALAAHAHQLGLKLGLYSDAGQATCQGRPGGMNYEKIDAKTYADWKIDYLKYDNCNDDGVDVKLRYPRMRDALNATGHPILFSMCEWGVEDPATWAPEVGNSWRTTGDISDNWNSMLSNLDQNDKWWNYSGPGAFNDPDMIEIQNGGMTLDEYTSHFSLWSLIKSPLIIGCDVTNLTSDTLAVLTNKEVISINQDPLGVQGHRVASQSINPSTNQLIDLPTNQAGDLEVWAGPLHNGDVAVILFNRGSAAANITADFKTIGLSTHQPINQSIKAIKATVRDLWASKDLGSFEDSITLPVNTHAVRMLRITPAKSNDQSINQSTKQSIKRSRHARW